MERKNLLIDQYANQNKFIMPFGKNNCLQKTSPLILCKKVTLMTVLSLAAFFQRETQSLICEIEQLRLRIVDKSM